jgi:hypothetical protein
MHADFSGKGACDLLAHSILTDWGTGSPEHRFLKGKPYVLTVITVDMITTLKIVWSAA